MKTFGQIWRVWVFKCRAQEDLANQNIIRGRKDESEDQFAIIWCVVFFKNRMLYFQWKILFWLLPTVWWMIMFIIVSYLLGWPHKKLTMSLIDLFPSANDVSTEPSVARVHNVLLAIIDSYYLPLMIILIICCEQEKYHRKIFDVVRLWLTHHHLIKDSSVCDIELDTEQWAQEEGTVDRRLSTSKTSEYTCGYISNTSLYVFIIYFYQS